MNKKLQKYDLQAAELFRSSNEAILSTVSKKFDGFPINIQYVAKIAWQKPNTHKKNRNFIKYLLLLNKTGKVKKIIKKLMQFKIPKYELLGSILRDQNSLSIFIEVYKL